ncbi:helix-turn-helix domain-containing protein [Pedobacter nyackensis]|uniref:winged helix-turn-helix domain-containing protein n=1 Tax=Pedobacter nyackensis TaxID=475255 RepID=UPI00292CCD32|nr:helix-turn-helix domain-containing protein [Pedobacter nyackensis]
MLINRRFRVNASRNEVLDHRTGKIVRLEPRLMKLLCLLIENHGQIVNRSLIIEQIWNDYPGADEGLNQAISGLRKLLEDDQKKIIETLPKTGYCFRGGIEKTPFKHQRKTLKTAHVLAGVLILIAILFLVRYYQATEATITDQLHRKEARHLYKIDSARQAERLKADKK